MSFANFNNKKFYKLLIKKHIIITYMYKQNKIIKLWDIAKYKKTLIYLRGTMLIDFPTSCGDFPDYISLPSDPPSALSLCITNHFLTIYKIKKATRPNG